jgi:hypothetical protein
MKNLDYIIQKALKTIVSEQAPQPVSKETNNAPSDAVDSPFTPAEEKFLGKFDAYGTTHIGIIYSTSDIGIREFITRSGVDLNITAGILASLLKQKVIKIVPYTGFGRNTDYTIELQLSLDDVKGLGADDKAKAETGPSASGAAPEGGAPAPEAPADLPAPEVAWVIPYGTLINEATKIAKNIINQPLTESTKQVDAKVKGKVWVKPSRMLKDMPPQFIKHLNQLITYLSKRSYSKSQHERIIADILDNLAINLKLNSKQIRKSYEFHKNQNKLQAVLDINESIIVEQTSGKPITPKYIQTWFSGPNLKLITDAIAFWDAIGASMAGDWTEEEEDFINACLKYITSRKAAIMIDAIGTIVYLANTGYGKNKAEAKFLEYYVMKYDKSGEGWEQLPIPDKNLSYAYSLKTLFNGSEVHGYVLDDNSVAELAKKLAAQLNSKSIGRLEIYDAKITLDTDPKVKQVYAKRTNTNIKASDITIPSMNAFFPTYSVADVNVVMGGLLAPFRAAAADKSKTTYADHLSQEQKVARGKYAKAQIIKMINAFYPKAKNKWTGSPYGKSWVDSKGAGIYILPPNTRDSGTKYIIYPDGTLKTYVNSNLKSTEKLTNTIVKYNNDKWYIKSRIIS